MGKGSSERFTLHELAQEIAREDGRSEAYMYHASLVAARELGIYARGRTYSAKEYMEMWRVVYRLFPGRNTD